MTDAAPAPAGSTGSYWGGIGLAFLTLLFMPWLLGVALGLLSAAGRAVFGDATAVGRGFTGLAGFGLMAIGLTQWLWLVPLSRWLKSRGKTETAKGVISGGWMIFILNAGCWGIFGGVLLFSR